MSEQKPQALDPTDTTETPACCTGATCEATPAQSAKPSVTARPNYHTAQSENGVTIEIDLPGVTRDTTRITSEGTRLTVTATRLDEVPADWNLLNTANPFTDYQLKLNTHPQLDLAKTKATFQLGTLILEIPKKEEALPKQIEITS